MIHHRGRFFSLSKPHTISKKWHSASLERILRTNGYIPSEESKIPSEGTYVVERTTNDGDYHRRSIYVRGKLVYEMTTVPSTGKNFHSGETFTSGWFECGKTNYKVRQISSKTNSRISVELQRRGASFSQFVFDYGETTEHCLNKGTVVAKSILPAMYRSAMARVLKRHANAPVIKEHVPSPPEHLVGKLYGYALVNGWIKREAPRGVS